MLEMENLKEDTDLDLEMENVIEEVTQLDLEMKNVNGDDPQLDLEMKNVNEEDTQLDPELWQGLPQELLERVIAHLPFPTAVAFRAVCKEWYSDIIPRAAGHVEATRRSVLLYSYSHEDASKRSARWLQVCYPKGACNGSVEEFPSNFFPAPLRGENLELFICERGLLFFTCKGSTGTELEVTRDIVVCNPLISKSKTLGLPRPLRAPHGTKHLIVGVTFASKTDSYSLVCAGVDIETRHHATFLYDSLTSTWTTGCPLSSLRREVIFEDLFNTRKRSFYRNGDVYWCVVARSVTGSIAGQDFAGQDFSNSKEFLLKFDSEDGTWSLIRNLSVQCDPRFSSTFHGAISKGEIVLWHLHTCPIRSRDGPPELLSCELSDRNLVRPPQYIDWPCRCDREVDMPPEIKLMPHYVMEKIYRFLHKLDSGSAAVSCQYEAFSERNCIYHVVVAPLRVNGLLVLVHDTNQDSFKELRLPFQRFPASHRCLAKYLWSFTASLTSLP